MNIYARFSAFLPSCKPDEIVANVVKEMVSVQRAAPNYRVIYALGRLLSTKEASLVVNH